MGAIPKIFQTGQQVNETAVTLNQTQLFLMEQEARENQTLYEMQHEDLARQNQTIYELEHENEQRDRQRYLIINETNNSMNRLEEHLMDFIHTSEKRSEKGQKERQMIIDDILNISKQHDKVAADHDKIQIEVANQTNQTYDLLDKVAERNYQGTLDNQNLLANLTEDVKNLQAIHNKLMKTLEHK
jgi:hypothetical protein